MADPIASIIKDDGSVTLELPDEVLRELGAGAGDTVYLSLTETGLHLSSKPLRGEPPPDEDGDDGNSP